MEQLWSGTRSDRLVTLFEYEAVDLVDSYELNCLERLTRTTGLELLKPVVQNGRLRFQARQYVGVLRLGRRTIQILPKIYRSPDRQISQQEATRNLLLMLDYAGYLDIRAVNLAALQRSQNWFEVLVYLFASHLKQAWQRHSHRSYQPVDAVLPVLKGKWQIATQLKRPEQKHQFAMTYDEFTVDNPLNQVFRYVVERLWQLTRDSNNRQLLAELRYWLDEVTLLPVVTVAMAERIQISRLNQPYEPLLNLARLFLEQLGLQLSVSDVTSFAFVFDMNRLFEGFITGFLQRHRDVILPPALQAAELLAQGQRAVRYLASRDHQSLFRLKPDLLLRVNDRFPVVLDLKYKQLKQHDSKLGVAESDFYQMYAYADRYDCSRVVLLYPQTAVLLAPQRAKFRLEGRDAAIWVVTVNLLQDLSTPEAKQNLQRELREILEEAEEANE